MVHISALKHCGKMKVRLFLHLTLISNFFMLSRLSDFVDLVQIFIFGVVGSISKV